MNEITGGQNRFELPNHTATQRARYVVERLADAVSGPSEQDWTQIQNRLTYAYTQILDAQRGYRVRSVVRPVLGLTLAYGLITVFQWQIDLLWGAHGVSAQTFLTPVLMLVTAPFLLMAVAMFAAIVSDISSVGDDLGFDPKSGDAWGIVAVLTAILVVCAGAVVGFAVLLTAVFHYTWLQAAVIVTVEPIVWILLAALTFSRSVTNRSARDPRGQLVADLVIFLAISAVQVDQQGQESHDPRAWDLGDFPPLRWPDIAYSTTADDRSRRSNERYFGEGAAQTAPEPGRPPDAEVDETAPVDPLPKVMRVSPDAWTWRVAPDMRRAFVEGLDLAAQRIESNLPKTIDRRQTTVRSSIRHTSVRIAATLRSYAVDVALGGDERDQALSEHLSSALVSASWGRWEELTAVEPQPGPRQSRIAACQAA